jgi:anaerobic magnesium-protoporphyrin IX monomethyl ester cyclase
MKKIIISTLNAKFVHSSLALRYLRGYCEKEIAGLELVEYTINDLTMNIMGDLYERKPDVVAFSCYIWNIRETLEVIKLLKKVCPDLPIVLGGPEVSYDTYEWMQKEPNIDFIVMGEGEETFLELLREMNKETPDYRDVLGLSFRENNKVKQNFPRPNIEDLNTIPSPYEDRLDELYQRMVYFEASRGCPFKCQYCLSSIEDGVRYFDLDRVKSELKTLIDHGVKHIKFVDRTFNIQRKYALEIFQFLIDYHKDTTFHFEITADILKPDIVDFLAENAPAGLFKFEIGVQSTNDETNRLVQRMQNFEKLSYTVTKIKQSGKIHQHLDLIAGLPEEDYASFRKTFNDVYALQADELQLGFLKMLRGTGVRARAADHGYVYMDDAPYEILGNNILSFDEMLRLKRVEDILEKYWNDHRMDDTIRYLLAHEFETPFDFYEAFGDYWEQQGWSRMGHQLIDLFERLDAFLISRQSVHLPITRQLMKFNYLLQMRSKRYATGWEDQQVFGEELEAFYRRFADKDWVQSLTPTLSHLTGKEVRKYTVLEKFSVDLLPILDSLNGSTGMRDEVGKRGNGDSNEGCYVLFYYPPSHKEEKSKVEYFILQPEDLRVGAGV